MKLILVEDEQEVKIFCKKFTKPEDYKWIALSPFAIPELEKLNINYEIINNYYNKEELWDVAEKIPKRVNELIKFVDELIKDDIEEFKNIDVLNCYKHQLIILFDGVIGRIFMLKSLLEKLKPAQIYICKRSSQPFSGYGYLFNQNDTLWANCLSLKGWHSIVNFTYSKGIMDENILKEKITLKSLLKKIPGCSRLIRDYRTFQKCGIKNYLKIFFLKRRILLLLSEYEWEDTIPLFLKNGFKVGTKSVDDLRKIKSEDIPSSKANALINKSSQRNEYKEKFIFENINFYSLLKLRIEGMIYEGITKGISIYNEAEKYIQNFRPKAVLFAIAPYPETWFFLQSFKKNEIPVICWQHGSEGFYNNRGTPETELLYTDYFFNYGKGVTETYLKFKEEYNFQSVPMGSSTMNSIANINKSKEHIAYVTTNYYQNNLYFSVFPDYLDIKIYHTQEEIVHYLETLQNEKIIFKLHPTLSYRTPPLEITKENIAIVRNEKKFTEILSNCKLIIIDIPSTVLLQCAVIDKPIFCLTSLIKLKQEALVLIKKRAVCAQTPEKLIKKLDNYLKTGNYPADVNNREFIKKYGTYLDDGKSAERAVNKVLEVIKEKCQSV